MNFEISIEKVKNSRIAEFDNTGLVAGYATPLQNFARAVTSVGGVMSLQSADTTGKIPLTMPMLTKA
jgi:hypothetical protein